MSGSVTSLLPSNEKVIVSKEAQAHFMKLCKVKQTGDPSRPQSDFERISSRSKWHREGDRIRKRKLRSSKEHEEDELHGDVTLTAGDFGLTEAELKVLQDGGNIQTCAEVWPYKFGNDLVEPSQVPKLPTQMRRLHQYYKTCKSEDFAVAIKDRDLHKGDGETYVSWLSVYELYQKQALDIPIMTLWTM